MSENCRDLVAARAEDRVPACERLADSTALRESLESSQWLSSVCRIGDDDWKWCANHPNVTVREWAALMLGVVPDLSFARRLAWIKIFVEDPHAGMRQISVDALRPHVALDVHMCIEKLVPWTGSRSERLRHFAVEITRPVGERKQSIATLLLHPELGLPILEPLLSDESPDVCSSIVQWLLEASSSRPDWVQKTLLEWANRWKNPRACDTIDRIRNLLPV